MHATYWVFLTKRKKKEPPSYPSHVGPTEVDDAYYAFVAEELARELTSAVIDEGKKPVKYLHSALLIKLLRAVRGIPDDKDNAVSGIRLLLPVSMNDAVNVFIELLRKQKYTLTVPEAAARIVPLLREYMEMDVATSISTSRKRATDSLKKGKDASYQHTSSFFGPCAGHKTPHEQCGMLSGIR